MPSAAYQSRDGFRNLKANVAWKGEGMQFFEEKQSSLAKTERDTLKGDLEHRRSRWSTAGNKATRLEYRNTDFFKDQCPIWAKRKANGPAKD